MKLALFLDCYGVLYVQPIELYLNLYPELKQDLSDLYKALTFGSISTAEFIDDVVGLIGEDKSHVKATFSSSLVLNQPLIDGIRSLDGKFDVYVMSNTTQADLNHLCDREELRSLPTRAWFSSEMLGVTKPSRESFNRVLGHVGEVDQVILIDDMAQNVSGAELAGWVGVYYTGVESVISSLEEIYNARTA